MHNHIEEFCYQIINATDEKMQVKIRRCISWSRFYQKYPEYHDELKKIVKNNMEVFKLYYIDDLINCLFFTSRIIFLRLKGFYNISLEDIFKDVLNYDIEIRNRIYE